jgi:7-cyano-7-deazaguanine reductase
MSVKDPHEKHPPSRSIGYSPDHVEIPLGRHVPLPTGHDPSILFSIRRGERQAGMHGFDLWRAYELSWLDGNARPSAGVMELSYPISSRNIVESKSLKLYLHGIAETRFSDGEKLVETIRADLAQALGTQDLRVRVLKAGEEPDPRWLSELPGICIDDIDIRGYPDQPDPEVLEAHETRHAQESLFSHLLRTYCPITGQPDWASVLVEYRGKRIDPASLLKYLCSYRTHQGFSEECCERIYRDILQRCSPDRLAVSCFYTRRGGIDINPVRSSFEKDPEETARYRLLRQ